MQFGCNAVRGEKHAGEQLNVRRVYDAGVNKNLTGVLTCTGIQYKHTGTYKKHTGTHINKTGSNRIYIKSTAGVYIHTENNTGAHNKGSQPVGCMLATNWV